jgi:hypothetical protein
MTLLRKFNAIRQKMCYTLSLQTVLKGGDKTNRLPIEEGNAMNKHVTQPEIGQRSVYSVIEIALILGMPERTAYAFCNKTTEFKVKRIGRLIRVNKQSFDEWWND